MKLIHQLSIFILCLAAGLLSPLVAAQTPPAGTVIYIHNDLLGSPAAATDQAGVVIWREAYSGYGERLKNESAGATNKVWYTSRHQDENTGLVYMGARYYDPALGRFLSVDPVHFVETNSHSFNRYAYANNNPYRFKDPDGKFAIDAIVVTGLVLGGAAIYVANCEGCKQSAGRALRAVGTAIRNWATNESAEGTTDANAPQKPAGIPDKWREEVTRGEGGREWVNPDNTGDRIRVMPGNPNSPHEGSREPYVRDVRGGNQWLDVNGNRIEGKAGRNSPDTHIPVKDYVFPK